MISRPRLAELLEPFELSPDDDQAERLLAYLELLLKWNSKINLVGPASDEECVTRHFGESLFLTRLVGLTGKLLDIGSGAGFPGLALKVLCPSLEVTLLEPIAKKRAFLKEVTRICHFDHVSVLVSRIEGLSSEVRDPPFDFATSRAVGRFEVLIENAADCLKPGGVLCLWLGQDQAAKVRATDRRFNWNPPQPIPLSRRREILIGELTLT